MIEYQCINIDFPFSKVQISNWLREVILCEGYSIGEIGFLFCDDTYLVQINQKYLNRDTLTDVITFPYSDNRAIVSGEIYISIDRVRENAIEFEKTFENELMRVCVHGILHLLGFDDYKDEEKILMRQKEDYYLSLLPNC